MPNYAWTCHVCDNACPARTETCTWCGYPAQASAAEIVFEQHRRQVANPSDSEPRGLAPPWATPAPAVEPAAQSSPGVGGAIGVGVLGVYLLAGAVVAWRTGRWPDFMPWLLDVVGWALGAFGSPTGAEVGAVLLAALGIGCLVLSAELLSREPATGDDASKSDPPPGEDTPNHQL